MRRAFLAAGAMGLAVSALAIQACRGIIGADESDYTDVVVSFCECWGSYGVYSGPDDCMSTVMKRLEQTEGKVLADWLTKYVKDCSGQCTDAVACYYTMPVCSFAACTIDKECCSYDGGAGTCAMGECAPLGP